MTKKCIMYIASELSFKCHRHYEGIGICTSGKDCPLNLKSCKDVTCADWEIALSKGLTDKIYK